MGLFHNPQQSSTPTKSPLLLSVEHQNVDSFGTSKKCREVSSFQKWINTHIILLHWDFTKVSWMWRFLYSRESTLRSLVVSCCLAPKSLCCTTNTDSNSKGAPECWASWPIQILIKDTFMIRGRTSTSWNPLHVQLKVSLRIAKLAIPCLGWSQNQLQYLRTLEDSVFPSCDWTGQAGPHSRYMFTEPKRSQQWTFHSRHRGFTLQCKSTPERNEATPLVKTLWLVLRVAR